MREGDLAAARVPVAALADRVGAFEGGSETVVEEQVTALVSLTEVWRRRLGEAAGLAELLGDEEAEPGEDVGADPACVDAARLLATLADGARGRLGRPAAPLAGRRLGAAADLWQAYAQAQGRRDRVTQARGLWPTPLQTPLVHQMRRLLRGLRLRRRVRLLTVDQPVPEAVAATLAALELVRRGRARLWQRRAYSPVVVLRPAARQAGEGS